MSSYISALLSRSSIGWFTALMLSIWLCMYQIQASKVLLNTTFKSSRWLLIGIKSTRRYYWKSGRNTLKTTLFMYFLVFCTHLGWPIWSVFSFLHGTSLVGNTQIFSAHFHTVLLNIDFFIEIDRFCRTTVLFQTALVFDTQEYLLSFVSLFSVFSLSWL